MFSISTLIDTTPIWGNTDVLGQNGRGKVNRSTASHYGIGMSLPYAQGLYRPTTVDVIQYLDRKRWKQCFSYKKC